MRKGKLYIYKQNLFIDRKEAAPRFIRKPRTVITAEGQTAKFDCKIIGASPPIVTW